MAYVYWIHLQEHTDINNEGYVGITSKTVDERIKWHLKDSKRVNKASYNYPIYHAFRKYEGLLIISTICECTIEYAKSIEFKLRPSEKIGWNLKVGGNYRVYGSLTQEHRDKLSKAGKGRIVSQESIEKTRQGLIGKPRPQYVIEAMSERLKGVPRTQKSVDTQKTTLRNEPWRISRSKKVWEIADQLYRFYKQGNDTPKKLSDISNLSISSITNIRKRFLNGWIPDECPYWLNYKENNEKSQQTD